MKKAKKLFLVILVLFLNGCMKSQQVIYYYTDGKNNTYIIRKNEVELEPLPDLLSSSGFENEAEGWKKQIDAATYEKIVSLLENALNDTQIQINQRLMGSAMISKEVDSVEQKNVIIKPTAPVKEQIEEILNNLKK